MPARKSGSTADPAASLAEYRRKRDFERTREPAGDDGSANRRSDLAFVIQKHAASHLHYDLRLELDGVMRSWAVPKGPSLDPSVRRLAMQVEDHPMEYNSFEGTIPQGEYGGGTVMLWDRGTYSPDEPARTETDAQAVRRGLRDGKLSFTFRGERLNGSFALVRTDRGPKPKWLLLKHRDDHADPTRDITDEVLTSVASGRTMEEIAAGTRVWHSNRRAAPKKTDGKPARAAKQQAADAPKMPGIELQRPRPSRELPEEGEWRFHPWLGGTAVIAWVTAEAAVLVSARGADVTKKARVAAQSLAALATRVDTPFVVTGELDNDGTLHVSDMLLEGDTPLVDHPAHVRRERLEALFRRRRVADVQVAPVADDGARLLARARRHGWAGIIAVAQDAPYVPGGDEPTLLRVAAR